MKQLRGEILVTGCAKHLLSLYLTRVWIMSLYSFIPKDYAGSGAASLKGPDDSCSEEPMLTVLTGPAQCLNIWKTSFLPSRLPPELSKYYAHFINGEMKHSDIKSKLLALDRKRAARRRMLRIGECRDALLYLPLFFFHFPFSWWNSINEMLMHRLCAERLWILDMQ